MDEKLPAADWTLPAETADVASPPDPLAEGLPGLPLELRRGPVDRKGFNIRTWRRGELQVPWSCVRGFRSFWHGSFAIEAQHPNEAEVHLVPLRAKRWHRRAIRAAWREYVLRRIEKDGELAGSYSLFRSTGQYQGAIAVGVITAAFGMLFFFAAEHPSAEPERILLWLMGAAYLFAGVLAVAAGVVMRSRTYAARLHWYRWRLTREGLTFWPFAEKTRLEPRPTDWIAPHAARLGRFTVPLENLTFRKPVAALLVAMGERSGARTRPLTWLQPCVLVVLALILWSTVFLAGAAEAIDPNVFEDYTSSLFLTAACAAAPTVWAIAAHVVSRRRLRRALSDGRAMLERLGW